jgi:spermidine/putrescine transport system permease protein
MVAGRFLRVTLRIYFVALVAFIYAPIALLYIFSLNNAQAPSFPLAGFTLRWYADFLNNSEMISALQGSALVALCNSIVTTAFGLLAGLVMARREFRGKALFSGLLLLPLVVPYIVLGIALLTVFSSLSLPLSLATVLVGHIVVTLPYTVLILVARLQRLDVRLEEAAQNLGASPIATFRLVTIPLMLPAIVASMLVAFTISFDEFALAYFLVGTQPTFPIYLFSQLRFPSRLPQVEAVAVLVMTASIVLVGIAEAIRRLGERRLGPVSGELPDSSREAIA